MSSQEVMSVVIEAAHRLMTVRIEITNEMNSIVHEVEPYSLIGRTAQTLYYWDVDSCRPTGVPLEDLTSAIMTDTAFVPRYAVEF